MTITDAQVNAAAKAMQKEDLLLGDMFSRRELHAIARAALEAGEAAKKEKVRPETREWWPDEAFAHHYGPTPPTEGDR